MYKRGLLWQGMVMDIENSQRQFTRLISGIGTLSYRQRLQNLNNLTTLLERRMRGDLIETFKIVNGLVNYGHNMFHQNTAYGTRNLRVTSHFSTKAAHDSLSNRVIRYWNHLPSYVKYAPSVNTFKASLDHFKFNNSNSPYGFWQIIRRNF